MAIQNLQKPITKPTYQPQVASLLIRSGLAAVFAYAAVAAFKEPNAWISFIPEAATKFVAAKTALDLISVFQLILAAWLIIGWKVRYSAVVSILLLGGIMLTNPATLLITFRDIGLIAAAAGLIFLEE